jgi:tRNA modification GTPase
MDPHDTIAAISSPPGFGLRGIVRVSGPDAWCLALSGFEPGANAASPGRRRASRQEGAFRLEGLRPLLPAAILFWPGPRTYTGQDLAEIHTLGSPPLLELLLSHLLALGARAAEAGEFTLRAFLSGRIDLTRAEAVLGVIDARTPGQLDAALAQLAGGMATPITALRDRLLDVLAHMEASLDFVDEPDVDELARAELVDFLARGSADLDALADRLRSRDRPEGYPRVVLAGPPNAGKSRLFNALLGAQHALVSPLAGTTRDYLSARCDCDGLTVELIDTAGEDAATTAIEARAQALRADQAVRADVLLECVAVDDLRFAGGEITDIRWVSEAQPTCVQTAWDGGLRFADPPYEDGHPPTASRTLRVLTKSDLSPGAPIPTDAIATSAATGEGIDRLRLAIASTVREAHREDDLATTTGARCRDSLARARDALALAAESLVLGAGDELVAVDLRQAIDELGKVVGAVVTDDILDRIFRRFCIGK